MNTRFASGLISCLLLIACTYDVPLAPDANLELDNALLGTWSILSEETGEPTAEKVVIDRGEGRYYLVEHHDTESIIYFKGWLAELEGIRFLQLQVTGDDEGPAGLDDANLFSVFAYTHENGELKVSSLNTDLVSERLPDTASLQEAFRAHKDNPALFSDPGRLRKL